MSRLNFAPFLTALLRFFRVSFALRKNPSHLSIKRFVSNLLNLFGKCNVGLVEVLMIVMIMHQAADQLSKCHHHSMWGCNHLTFKLSTTFLQNLAYTLQQAFSASRMDCETRNYASKINIKLRNTYVWIFRVVQNLKPCLRVRYSMRLTNKIGLSFISAFI